MAGLTDQAERTELRKQLLDYINGGSDSDGLLRLLPARPLTRYELLVNVKSHIGTAVHRCAIDNDLQMVWELLADLTPEQTFNVLCLQTANGDTALHVAACRGNKPVMQYLLERVNQPLWFDLVMLRRWQGHTVLHYALANNKEEVARLIISPLTVSQLLQLITIKDADHKSVVELYLEKVIACYPGQVDCQRKTDHQKMETAEQKRTTEEQKKEMEELKEEILKLKRERAVDAREIFKQQLEIVRQNTQIDRQKEELLKLEKDVTQLTTKINEQKKTIEDQEKQGDHQKKEIMVMQKWIGNQRKYATENSAKHAQERAMMKDKQIELEMKLAELHAVIREPVVISNEDNQEHVP